MGLFPSIYGIFIESNSGRGLILTKISNPIRLFKKIKHFDLKSAILCSENPNSMLLEYFKKFSKSNENTHKRNVYI
jgi:hypothetical protein